MDDTELQFCNDICKHGLSEWKYVESETHSKLALKIINQAAIQGFEVTEIGETFAKELGNMETHFITFVTAECAGKRRAYAFSTFGEPIKGQLVFTDAHDLLTDQQNVNRAIHQKVSPVEHFLTLRVLHEREQRAIEDLQNSLPRQFPQGISLDRCEA